MRTYEATVIFSPKTAGEIPQEGKKIFEGLVQKHGGKTLNFIDLGKKTLGYAVKKTKEGHCLVFDFTLAPDQLDSLKKAAQLIEDILLVTIVVKPSIKPAARKGYKPPRSTPAGVKG